MFYKIGALVICFGVMCADSRNVFIPLSMVLAGAVMMLMSEGGKSNE